MVHEQTETIVNQTIYNEMAVLISVKDLVVGIKRIVHPKLFTHPQFISNLYDFRRTEKKKFGKIVHSESQWGRIFFKTSLKNPSQKHIYRIIQAHGDGMSKS